MNAPRIAWTYWAAGIVVYFASVLGGVINMPGWPVITGVAAGLLCVGTYHLGHHHGFYECWAQGWDAGRYHWPSWNHKDREEWHD